jgi:hypothetical protein
MKTNDTKIITNFNIYITYKDKIKNVKIIFLLGNKYIKEEMCEKRFQKVFACHVEKRKKIGAICYVGAIFLAGTVQVQERCQSG